MRRIFVSTAVIALSLALAACGGSGAGGSVAPSTGASAPPANAGGGGSGPCSVVSATGEVAGTIAGNAFAPSPVALTAGQTVTFTNNDSVSHTVTLDDGSCDTGPITGGASAGLTFSAAGSYPFHCAIHPSMTGTVEVS